MTSELSILGIVGLLVTLTVAARSLAALATRTPEAAAPLPGDLVALLLFAPAVLILGLRDLFDGTTILAAQAFLGARLLHLVAIGPRLRWLRGLTGGLSSLAILWLYLVPILLHGDL